MKSTSLPVQTAKRRLIRGRPAESGGGRVSMHYGVVVDSVNVSVLL